jgi:hypothetical protein
MEKQSKLDCINHVYNNLVKYTNNKIINFVCDSIENDIIINFLFLQIKGVNIPFIKLLFHTFKNSPYMRDLINNSMIELLIASFDDSNIFFEMFTWFQEFGYNSNTINPNIITVLYIHANKFPKINKYIHIIINQINISNIVHYRSIFFIYDDIDIIKKYISKNKDILTKMLIKCYYYNSINILKQIQYKNKLNFFDIEWYLLSPECFNNHMINSERNPYENNIFAEKWTEYICCALRWDYLPLMINKLTVPMWKKISNYFYMGYLTNRFVTILFHQMKINNILFENLKSKNLKFNPADSLDYLQENNLYNIFKNNEGYIIKNKQLTDMKIAQETTVVSVASMLVIFEEKNIEGLIEIIFDTSLNMSQKYDLEIIYIDNLLKNNQLGWNDKQIKTYENFKIIMAKIIDQANLSQDLVTKYNSFLPIVNNNMPYSYQLRYINHFINLYNKLTLKKYKDEYNMIYNTCIKLKQSYIKEIRKETNTDLDNQIFFIPPKNATIFDKFKNLIENSECFDYSYEQSNKFWIDELHDNKLIQNIVRNMLTKYHVPIQEIIPILYNYYSYYAIEEHFFLE